MLPKISCDQAAKIMQVNGMYVRMGLRCGRLPIGSAIQETGKRWTYHISPGKLAEYLGITLQELENELKAIL